MKQESIDKLQALLIAEYRKRGDKPYVVVGRKAYSGEDMAKEVEGETDFGVDQINKLIQLTINLLSRGKLRQYSKVEVHGIIDDVLLKVSTKLKISPADLVSIRDEYKEINYEMINK